ncbi:Serine protease HTRA2 [Acropora cervicornis]|uniref:Serine protease HTRA2 n=1 Tax=Acropora cervicornis TaxID=6130 RepID=A0AAD9VFT0_ACRCE|nr:Serine protease HTRA2 [Acropora cervicornis]
MFSTETKKSTRRLPWPWMGSLALGGFLGYAVPKFIGHCKCSGKGETKNIPTGGNESDSGSTPRSARFNFIADAVEKAAPAVVNIEVTGRHPGFVFGTHTGPTSAGSGFIVTEDGMVLTNAHLVENAMKVSVKLKDGRQFSGIVTVKFPTLTLGSSSSIRPGEWVVAMGSPLQLSNTITAGIVSTVHRAGEEIGLPNRGLEYIQTDAAINIGNSGGPLVNLDGDVIGINAITMRFAAGISFSIPIDAAKDFLSKSIEKVRNGDYRSRNTMRPLAPYQRWYIGITMLTLTPQILNELRRRDQSFHKVEHGVLVAQINNGSPAQRLVLWSILWVLKMTKKKKEDFSMASHSNVNIISF